METSSADTIKVSDLIQRGSTRIEGDYGYDDFPTEGPVHVAWEIAPATAGLTVHGKLDGIMRLTCDRCLGEFPVPADLTIDERYVFESYVDPFEREKELQAQDFFEVVSEQGVLDLKDLAYQFLILESANHPTCGRADCDTATA